MTMQAPNDFSSRPGDVVSFHRSGLGNASGRAAVASQGCHAGRAPVLLPRATDNVDQRFYGRIHVRFAMPAPSKVHQ